MALIRLSTTATSRFVVSSNRVRYFKFDVVHVIESFSAGSREIVRLLANEQVSRGLAVAVLHGVIEGTPCPANEGFSHKVELIEIKGFNQRDAASVFSALLEILKFRKNVEWRATHFHSSIAGTVGRMALLGKPHTVYTPHGCVFMHTEKKPLQFFAACLIERICTWLSSATTIACSKSEQKILLQSLGKAKVVLIPNGIERAITSLKAVGRVDDSRLQVVALGRISSEKNYDDLVSLKRSNYGNYRITVIGGGDAQQTEKLKAEGIEVTGWMSHQRALSHLEVADVLVHPSNREGMPLSILEAFARRVIVVARDSPGNRDLVESGITGYLYDHSDQLNSLMDGLKNEFIGNADITSRAHNLVESDYSVEVMCSRYIEEYASAR